MQAQANNSSEEDLSKYKKRGYEYVEEEKVLLDEIVTLYRKRLDIARNQLEALESLHSTVAAKFDSTNSLYVLLVSPILDSLQEDIKGHRQYAQGYENDLARITFGLGSSAIATAIKQDMEAVKALHLEYMELSSSVLQLPRPPVPADNKWPYDEDIKHRRVTARLHTKQKAARMHFETTYPELLDDHMEYIEQVKKLSLSNATRRSELSTSITRHASRERILIDEFSTADAIAVPHLKMGLEMDRREYRHAPVLNLLTREMEEGRVVIFGREIQLESGDDPAQEVVVACLEQLPGTIWSGRTYAGWEYYWCIILAMELNSSGQAIRNTIFEINNRDNIQNLITIMLTHTRMCRLRFNIGDEQAMVKLKDDQWDRSALMEVVKDVDPLVQRVFKACAIAWITAPLSPGKIRSVFQTWSGIDPCENDVLHIILQMWDYELWRPLPDDVKWMKNDSWRVCRMKRFRAKPGYKLGGWPSGWVWLDVDGNGDVVDTPENQELEKWIRQESIRKEPKSRFSKFLQKLNV